MSFRQRRGWYPSLPLVTVVALLVLAQLAQPVRGTRGSIGEDDHSRGAAKALAEELDRLQLVSSPAPSGADPPYPLNHTLDGEFIGSVADLGANVAEGVVDWTREQLLGASDEHPEPPAVEEPEAGDRPLPPIPPVPPSTVTGSCEPSIGSTDGRRIWRATRPAETAQIIQATGTYKVESGLLGKYFYPTQEQAIAFGQRMPGGPYSLTSGFAPAHVLESAECINPAGEGSAYFIHGEHLDEITNVVVHGVIS